MKPFTVTKKLVLLLLALLGVAAVAAFSFHEGRDYQGDRDTITRLNDVCFNSWVGLMALNGTNKYDHTDDEQALDSELDLTSGLLAVIALKHPSLIGPGQYSLLVKVRQYRKSYGRHYQFVKGAQVDPALVDKKIEQAINYLGTIHDTNEWLAYHGKFANLVHEIEAQQKK